MIFGGILERFV